LSLYLNTDHIKISTNIRDDTHFIKGDVTELRQDWRVADRDRKFKALLACLGAPDVSIKHGHLREERQITSGQWILNDPLYNQWRISANSSLWIHGIPGSGKTFICSRIIDDNAEYCNVLDSNAFVYFYFDSTDSLLQQPSELLRSMILQLVDTSSQTRELFEEFATGPLRLKGQSRQSRPQLSDADLLMISTRIIQTLTMFSSLWIFSMNVANARRSCTL